MMIALAFIALGLLFSAFFSGMETGFYRATRVRLVLSSKSGSRTSRGLLWLTNHPTAFVSTGLIGNNLANYSISLGLILIVGQFTQEPSRILELLIPILSTPFVFVYGELLPKYLFYQSPNRLLSLGGPLFLVFVVLLAPISIALYGFCWLLQRWTGTMPLRIKPELARKELQQVLQEGADAGLLLPLQRDMAKNVFDYGGQQIIQSCMPVRGLRCVESNTPLTDIVHLAQRNSQPIIAVLHPRAARLVGYIRTIDVLLAPSKQPKLHPVLSFRQNESQIHAVTEMVAKRCELARILDQDGRMIGVVLKQRLLYQMTQAA